MNKCMIKSLVVALVMLVPCLVYALPGAHDPVSGRGYTCNSCHTSGATVGQLDINYSSNVCLRCHTSGGSSGDAVSKFLPEDYSNVYNSTSLTRTSALQTSHKWFGSDVKPAAGALAPVDTSTNGLNKSANFMGTLFCARCHNVHGTSGVESNEKPYLRYPNKQDQICLNCHRPRDTKDHKLGTHPVNVSYTSARNANALANIATMTTFRVSPVTNETNPTGQVKLYNDKVVCSTCHGTHNTDSRTSTFDPYSSGHTFGNLSSSKGYLLRVDAFGKTADDVNICTNCHVSRNHNVKLSKSKPSVQCNDCHSGHVEYDAAAPAEVKNVYLVRRYLQYTTAGRVSKRILYRSVTVKEYWNSTKTGVCQACHTPPQNHYATPANYPNGVFSPISGYTTCTGCHNHAEPAGAFSYGTGGSCSNSCHGLPPTTSTSPGPTGPVAGYTSFNEALTPHGAHALNGGTNTNDFDCNECHNGYTMPRDNPNTVKEVFVTPRALPGLSASYSGSKCNNVYCHSTGNGTWKPAMNPISWSSPKGLIIGSPTECQACHDDPNSSLSHIKHVTVGTGMGYGCVNCHAATVLNNTTLLSSAKVVGGSHTNGIKEVQYSQTGAAVGTTCANVKCHSNGKGAVPIITPVWGSASTGACGACHLTGTSVPVLATGSHTVHFGIIGGTNPLVVCVKCHIYVSETNTNHVNGILDVTSGCSSCHASPYSAVASTPTWGTVSTGCGQCHSGVGAFTGTGQAPNTGGHNKHMSVTLATCATCHTGAIAGTTGGAGHLSTFIDVTNVGYPSNVVKHTAGSGYTTCSAASCHADPYGTKSIVTPTWGASVGCISCHTGVGAFTGASSSPTTGSHPKHIAYSPLCSNCHAGAVAGTSGGNAHVDTNIDVTNVGYAANVTKHTTGSGYKTCSSASCHASPYGTSSVTSPTWGVVSGCVSCHTGAGAFTGAGSSPTTGSHPKHIAASATCSTCHAGAVAGTSGGNFHNDTNVDVIGGYPVNVTKHAATTYSGTCSATVCHGSSSPVWGLVTTYDYCTKCHGAGTTTVTTGNRYVVAPNLPLGTDTGSVSANVKTGAHQTHLRYLNGFSNYSTIDYRCEACHGTLPSANTYSHANGTSSPVGKFSNLATKWGAMTGQTYVGTTCSNVYCHNPAGTNGTLKSGNVGANTAPSWVQSAYIADGTKKTLTNCNKCHKVPGEVGFTGFNHGSSTIATVCVGCHGHEGDTQGAEGHRHMDGKLFGGGVNCNDCHGYPPMTQAQLDARAGGEFVYGGLTKYTEGAGYHASHLLPSVNISESFTPCLPCHPSAYHNQNNGIVLRANVQVNDVADTGYRFDDSRSKRYNAILRTCSNVSCHFQPTTSW